MRNDSKWSLCFRPPSTIEIDDGVDCSADRMLSLIATARNSNRLNGKKKKNKNQEKKKSLKTKSLDSSIPDHHPPSTTSRRSFASVVRAVLFETSLSRRVREAKLRNHSVRSVREPPSDEAPIAAADQKSAIAVDSRSNLNHPEKNTCAPPASDCSFTSIAENAKQIDISTGSTGKINPVVCMVLLSLLVTVFCGRLCAVMTTTVWIYAWQSGVVVVGLGEMLKMRRKEKEKGAGAAMEDTEKGTDNFCAKGNQLMGRGLIGN